MKRKRDPSITRQGLPNLEQRWPLRRAERAADGDSMEEIAMNQQQRLPTEDDLGAAPRWPRDINAIG